ncbi:MAG: glycerate kinase [Microthrixaceae bacterium]|nr:glycerate kinase [Microthrixaceae bacterium]
MRILVAPDKFRGTLSAAQAAAALAAGLRREGHETVEMPLADGGEGTLDVLGGANRTSVVSGPLGDPVEAPWRLARRSAVIEMARASGLELVGGPEHNDPVAASTVGTGQLISNALELGAKEVLVTLGGSATTDGGLGALRAMAPLPRFKAVELVVACDVRTPFLEAADQFAPQKGAGPAQVELLRRRLAALAEAYAADHGVDVTSLEGAGAAGGLAGGLACAGAQLVGGFDLVAERLGLDEALAEVDAVVTGEGFLDDESFDGKVVGGVLSAARRAGLPALAVVGDRLEGASRMLPTVSLVEEFGREAALSDAGGCLFEAAPLVGPALAGAVPAGRPTDGY